jgi:hypothetical protein
MKARRRTAAAVEVLAECVASLPKPEVVEDLLQKMNAEWTDYELAFTNEEEDEVFAQEELHYKAICLRMAGTKVVAREYLMAAASLSPATVSPPTTPL